MEFAVGLYLTMNTIVTAVAGLLLFLLLSGAASVLWLVPARKWRQLRRNGLTGPNPRFPLGNLMEMSRPRGEAPPSPASSSAISHDIHSSALPYFSRWREAYGKVFVYWIGAEPFLYVEDPEFLKLAATGAMGKKWGKPDVFKHDRKPMFGNGLVMVEGNDWTIHRNIISPAFSMTNLNGMVTVMQETTCKMMAEWEAQLRLAPGRQVEIDVEKQISGNAAEIIAKTSFGMSEERGKKVFEKLQLLQKELFFTNRLVGVPFAKVLNGKKSYEAWKLGKEIDWLLHDIISSMKDGAANSRENSTTHQNLLGLLLAGNKENSLLERKLTTRELVDECKTFFFAGHETTGLALSWALLLLALYPKWQTALREEVMEVTGGGPLNSAMLSQLTKMGWVWNEVLRLYSPAPNVQRQAREDIRVSLSGGGDEVVIPKGTNMWIDVVGMHHDAALWGEDVNEFKPERFSKEVHGGCKHRMGFLPFGFSGRICVGRNLSSMEFRIVLSLLLRRFSFSVSPAYTHSPTHMLSLRPSLGVPLIVHSLHYSN